ncbi:MAG: SRPBCC family protein [Chloroflexota bacterium]
MTRLERHLETRLGTDDAFAFIADFGNAMHWDPGVATSEAVSAGPAALGSRYRLGVRMGSRVVPMEYRITAFEAPNRVVLAGEGSGVTATDEIRFSPSPSGTGTAIDYVADIQLGGWMRAIQPLLGKQFDALARNAVDGMKRTLDARADAAVAAATDATPAPAAEPKA